ncbi:MAG: Smr/MutS family protein [Spirochaetaceae bacterium]|nr:Smr/MutS family protein [Spirochaetaceae bacterium]
MGDFGKILEIWEKRIDGKTVQLKKKNVRRGLKKKSVQEMQAKWLQENPVPDKDKLLSIESPQERRRRLSRIRPQDVIDLHALKQDEAWASLDRFFISAWRRGVEKVLIIHGKGMHSPGNEGVLKKMCKSFLEQCRFAGEAGEADKSMGGGGATWVILKRD